MSDVTTFTEQHWLSFWKDGYVKLGKVVSDDDMQQLRDEIDRIMLGEAEVDYDRMLMQLDSESGKYEDAGPQTKGHKGATLNYRKIQDLEYDPVFLRYMQHPMFKSICDQVYGGHTPVSCFRAMFFNKPAGRGTVLPWHQDRWNNLDRDPLVTVWTAMDPATKANGCVQIMPGSHRLGVVNPEHGSGFMNDRTMAEHCPEDKVVYLELEAGEVALLHNWLMHRSDVNRSGISRRAFSVCYADARTKTHHGHTFPLIFGPGALDPDAVSPTNA
mgnify:FL=1